MRTGFWFTIFAVSMFMLTMMNQVVSASVIQEERTLYIQNDDLVDYVSLLNIVNNSNVQFTNYENLVTPFIQSSGISGGFSGSMMPPARFDFNTTTGNGNDHLILVSFVEFTKKNLLSGSSISWWRCPYYYNYSNSDSRTWQLNMTIYHVDAPRNVNVSFDLANPLDNHPVVPTDEAHPSIIFNRQFSDCGNLASNDDFQWASHNDIVLPVNDTLTDPDLPYDETTNPYLYTTTQQYAHTWFNVTAPIYPNESYMVVWDVFDSTTGDEGAFWVTASDIGNNDYGRSIVVFNNRTVNVLPIDLDSSVIFYVGMGAGVTGAKLDDVGSGGYIDHTSTFSNMNFEYTNENYTDDFTTSAWWYLTSDSTEAYASQNQDEGMVNFYCNTTGSLSFNPRQDHYCGISHGDVSDDLGQTLKAHIRLNGASYQTTSAYNVIYNAQMSFTIKDSYGDEHVRIAITRRSVMLTTGTVVTDNYIAWRPDGDGTWYKRELPLDLPEELYVTFSTYTDSPTAFYFIYGADNPNFLVASGEMDDVFYEAGLLSMNYIYCAVDDSAGFSSATLWNDGTFVANQNVAQIMKISWIENTWQLGWGTAGDVEGITKVEFYSGFETTVPEYDPVDNTKCLAFIDSTWVTSNNKYVYQSQAFPSTYRTIFFSGYYKLDNFRNFTAPNSYIYFTMRGSGGLSGTVSNTVYGTSWDCGWHRMATSLTGSFANIEIRVGVNFNWADTFFGNNIAFCDNLKIESIPSIDLLNYYEFKHDVDTSDWNDTNYYSLMIPFKHEADPLFSPICKLEFKNSLGATVTSYLTNPTQYYGDFILVSLKTEFINPLSDYVIIKLYSFGEDSYLFLFDKNSDFYLNNKFDYSQNHFVYKHGISGAVIEETFFSPYYSLRTTEGEWTNADSSYTTTYFYYVIVYFVEFNDNDPEIISIKFDEVAVEDFEVYRIKMSSFGRVYTAEEWLSYLEIKNRPTFMDKIVDALTNFAKWLLENTIIGRILMAIGKFIYEAILFLAPYVESLVNFILEAFVFMVSVIIYFLATWIMWNFTKFWILVGQDRVEEGLAELTKFTASVTALGKKGVGVVGTVATGGKV